MAAIHAKRGTMYVEKRFDDLRANVSDLVNPRTFPSPGVSAASVLKASGDVPAESISSSSVCATTQSTLARSPSVSSAASVSWPLRISSPLRKPFFASTVLSEHNIRFKTRLTYGP